MRINPHELHIKDPYYYEEIYAPSSRKRDKYPRFAASIGLPGSMIATTGHDHHRFRRGLLNGFFSKRSVLELSPIIQEKESKLMQRFEKAYHDGTILQLVDAFAAFTAFTADLISQYSWGVSSGFLDDKNFKNDFRQAITETTSIVHVYKFFPILGNIPRAMPRCLLSRLRPKISSILDMQDLVTQQSTSPEKLTKTSSKTIFDALSDPSVPLEERSPRRLEDEGLLVLLAGVETTTRVLALAVFYIYQNKLLITKLREELRPVMPTPTTEASWTQLEQLPYLVRSVSLDWAKRQ